MATEQGLLEIGRAKLLKEQEISNKLKAKVDLLAEIREYKTKSMLVSSTAIITKVEKYLEILGEEEDEYVSKIKALEEDVTSTEEENGEYIEEIEKLETRVEEYWLPRVEKLRNKCISKNVKIYRLILLVKVLVFLLVISNFYFLFFDQVIQCMMSFVHSTTEFAHSTTESVTESYGVVVESWVQTTSFVGNKCQMVQDIIVQCSVVTNELCTYLIVTILQNCVILCNLVYCMFGFIVSLIVV